MPHLLWGFGWNLPRLNNAEEPDRLMEHCVGRRLTYYNTLDSCGDDRSAKFGAHLGKHWRQQALAAQHVNDARPSIEANERPCKDAHQGRCSHHILGPGQPCHLHAHALDAYHIWHVRNEVSVTSATMTCAGRSAGRVLGV